VTAAPSAPVPRALERACRESYGRLVALLATQTRDVAAAEDALGDAFESALRTWPSTGLPDSPEAWLLTAARRRLVDGFRRSRTHVAARDAVLEATAPYLEPDLDACDIPDERLKLMFACTHPALDATIRAPLMLQTVLGLDAKRIAARYLVAPKTMGQRLSRAKAKIRDAGIPFAIPAHESLPERLGAVHEAIYAAFGAAWEEAGTPESPGVALAEEAIWLARISITLVPDAAEGLGLLALMLHCHARQGARRDPAGAYVPLDSQDTTRWRGDLIDEAEGLLRTAARFRRPGPYQLEAAVQSAHNARRATGTTDWPAIRRLYAGLLALRPSVGAAVGAAVAEARAGDAQQALTLLDRVPAGQAVDYCPYWAALADIMRTTGRYGEAQFAYRRAIATAAGDAERQHLTSRLAQITLKTR